MNKEETNRYITESLMGECYEHNWTGKTPDLHCTHCGDFILGEHRSTIKPRDFYTNLSDIQDARNKVGELGFEAQEVFVEVLHDVLQIGDYDFTSGTNDLLKWCRRAEFALINATPEENIAGFKAVIEMLEEKE